MVTRARVPGVIEPYKGSGEDNGFPIPGKEAL